MWAEAVARTGRWGRTFGRKGISVASILIACSIWRGSAQEVAEAIRARLSEDGAVEIRPIGEARSISGFDSVVLGAPIYSGQWEPPAVDFLKRHQRDLAGLPTAISALGPPDTTDETFRRSRRLLDRPLDQACWLGPVSVELFGGQDPSKGNGLARRDARDLAGIQAWADALPDVLRPEYGMRVTRPDAPPEVEPRQRRLAQRYPRFRQKRSRRTADATAPGPTGPSVNGRRFS